MYYFLRKLLFYRKKTILNSMKKRLSVIPHSPFEFDVHPIDTTLQPAFSWKKSKLQFNNYCQFQKYVFRILGNIHMYPTKLFIPKWCRKWYFTKYKHSFRLSLLCYPSVPILYNGVPTNIVYACYPDGWIPYRLHSNVVKSDKSTDFDGDQTERFKDTTTMMANMRQ